MTTRSDFPASKKAFGERADTKKMKMPTRRSNKEENDENGTPIVRRFARYVSRYDGKDKLGRSVQYFLKGLSYYMMKNIISSSPETVSLGKRLHDSYKQISITRKTFRLFRWVTDFLRAVDVMRNDEVDVVDRTLKMVANLSMAVWAILDNVIWAFSIGLLVLPKSTKLLVRTRQRQFRVLTACCKLAVALRAYAYASSLQGKAKEKISHNAIVSSVKNLCDVFSYAKGAHAEWLVLNVDCHNGVSGMAGFCASVIAMRKIWGKC